MDYDNHALSGHPKLKSWIDDCAKLCKPERVVWIDGSEEEKKRLETEALKTGELVKLDEKKFPGCFYHRSASNDVARTEHLTFICSRRKEDAGPTNNWMPPEEGYRRAGAVFEGSMKGRTMYIIPFSMGVVGSPFSKIGVQLTDSIYVVLNMRIMTRVGKEVLDALGKDGSFTKCLHGTADMDISKRLILHFPDDNAIWSVGSGYGGNALLGKKCLALRIASNLARHEGWLAEHMLILGIEDKTGHTKYVTAAFPSACGKTNLAMLVAPEALKAKGYKVWTVGDDIAWLKPGPDGRLWAMNPEFGFFGVAPGTNSRTNPHAMDTVRKNTIFTNTLLGKDGSVWWEGGDGEPPAEGWDWMGRPWTPGLKDAEGKPIVGAHPNSRFTAPAGQCPSISKHWQDPQGVPISAMIFGGRRQHLAPLVYQSFDWAHGVFVGASMASERTAAQVGKLGEVRRDPMAMLPFCGYNMADYWGHWLDMGRRLSQPPAIFQVNWFRRDSEGEFIWPGFGENMRVLRWVRDRVLGRGPARETPAGLVPEPSAIGGATPAALEQLLAVDREAWAQEADEQSGFLDTFGSKLPEEIRRQHDKLVQRVTRIPA
ncbi:MAG TPA: phosphoenolpyruvate carboxykinase (GTP) [Elusimicrobiota bacterium]|nr:phosphoenolpyruvate carboxykinase (GTP) [Elusimicrobiota bacterium]